MNVFFQKNFHYIFNLRDLSNVFAGMLFSTYVRNCRGLDSILANNANRDIIVWSWNFSIHQLHVQKQKHDSGVRENTRGSGQVVGPRDIKGEIRYDTWHSRGRQVYRDKLSDSKDLEAFDKAQKDFLKKKFEEMNEADIMIKPLIFCHFAEYVFLKSFLYCLCSSQTFPVLFFFWIYTDYIKGG